MPEEKTENDINLSIVRRIFDLNPKKIYILNNLPKDHGMVKKTSRATVPLTGTVAEWPGTNISNISSYRYEILC